MKQKKIGTTLYVFDTTAYQITEDTDAAVIKIQLECIPAFELLNESLKDKFEPINYKLYCVQHPEWADYYDDLEIIIAPTTNGTVTVSPASADMGEEVTITTTPDAGYKLDTLTVMCGDVEVQVTDNKFTMPVESVVVTATFEVLPYEEQYFTLEATKDGGSLTIKTEYIDGGGDVYVSEDKGQTWNLLDGDTTYSNIQTGNTYSVKYVGNKFVYDYGSSSPFDINEAEFKVYGNAMSLIYGDEFIGKTSFPKNSNGNLSYLFYGVQGLTDASNLILPATTLTNDCYRSMFETCVRLNAAPELPATTLANSCYYSMFNGCTSLTTAPELPATTLTDSCYLEMFQSCSSLNYIKCLATDKHGTNCCSRWVSGVAATGTFVKAASMTWGTGTAGIPSGWTVEDYTPSV